MKWVQMKAWWMGIAAMSLGACAHGTKTAEPAAGATAAQVAPTGPWYGDLRALAEEAARVRGGRLTQTFEIVSLADEPFLELFRSFSQGQNDVLVADLVRTFAAFKLAEGEKPIVDGRRLTTETRDVQQEQVIAFYHFPSHRLVVRAELAPAAVAMGEQFRMTILAHEVGHVLQDQAGLAPLGPAPFEAVLTKRALLEGDATLTAMMVLGARKGHSGTRAVERGRVTLQMISPEKLIELTGLSPKLLSASPLVRELFVFPYFRGQRFVSDVYRAGGLELLSQALARPPVRTDGVLGPQRWLDGRPARLITPGGEHGHLGAVLFRSLLETCLQKPRAGAEPPGPDERGQILTWFDESYEDDVYSVDGDRLTWASAWSEQVGLRDPIVRKLLDGSTTSTRAAAVGSTAMALVQRFGACLGLGASDAEIAGRGSTVGLVARGAAAERAALAAQAAATPRDRGAAAPFGARVVPPPSSEVAYRLSGPGQITGQRWTHDRLSMTLDLPSGFAMLPNPVAALSIMGNGAIVLGVFVDDEPTPKNRDVILDSLLGSIFEGAKVTAEGFSLSQQHTWVDGTAGWTTMTNASADYPAGHLHFRVRARSLDLCGGRASMMVLGLAMQEAALPGVAAVLDALHGASPSPPICADP